MVGCIIPSKLKEWRQKLIPIHNSQISIHPLRKSNFLSVCICYLYLLLYVLAEDMSFCQLSGRAASRPLDANKS